MDIRTHTRERGSVLLMAMVAVVGLLAAVMAYYGMTTTHLNDGMSRDDAQHSRGIAEAGANAAMVDIANGGTGNLAQTEFGSGTYEVSATDHGDNTYTLRSTGTYGDTARIIEFEVATPSLSAIVRGAITSRAAITTLGTLTVDGRDYSAAGVLVDAGTYGLSTPGSYTQSGNSRVGGQGLAPAKPAHPNAYEENGPPPYPATPEELFGLDPGTLDAIATDVPPTFPLDNEVYYYTGDLEDVPISGSGILIVHNPEGTAKLKNLNGTTFSGIIIADDVEHIHMDILGALVHLSNTASGNCIGNGSGRVRYSSEIIAALATGGLTGLFPVRNCWRDVTHDPSAGP